MKNTKTKKNWISTTEKKSWFLIRFENEKWFKKSKDAVQQIWTEIHSNCILQNIKNFIEKKFHNIILRALSVKDSKIRQNVVLFEWFCLKV